jgi:sugar phosphate isomerase/epimerase
MNLITVQEQHLPGDTLEQKFETAVAWGFDGIELRSKGDLQFASRLPDLKRARANGVVMPTTC